jgi:hypothetical protein
MKTMGIAPPLEGDTQRAPHGALRPITADDILEARLLALAVGQAGFKSRRPDFYSRIVVLSNSGPAVRQDSEGWELGPTEDRYIKGGILMYPAGNLCGGVREWASSYSE